MNRRQKILPIGHPITAAERAASRRRIITWQRVLAAMACALTAFTLSLWIT